MKKIIALLLALSAIFTMAIMTSCEKEEPEAEPQANEEVTTTPDASEKAEAGEKAEEPKAEEPVKELSLYEKVSGAIKNTLASTSFEAKVESKTESDIMGNKSSASKDLTVKTAGANISVVGTKNEYDYNSEVNYYYDGSWMYFDMYGDKYKRQAPLEEFSAEAGGVAGAIVEIPEAAFANASDNNGVIEIPLDEATVETLYNSTIVALVQDIVGQDLNQTTTKDAKISLTISDGYIADYNLSLMTEIVVGNDRAAYTFNQSIKLSNYGQIAAIEFPAGYQNFSELDWG